LNIPLRSLYKQTLYCHFWIGTQQLRTHTHQYADYGHTPFLLRQFLLLDILYALFQFYRRCCRNISQVKLKFSRSIAHIINHYLLQGVGCTKANIIPFLSGISKQIHSLNPNFHATIRVYIINLFYP